ncbi:TniQ family protein [Paenibacillus glycanilyticus]|uniref:TniQ domain-containing protein n=1 Tax=Paenibacillus glycanilyticus TaxID=126569 RepID=A0ABQ6GQ01_9BACL|nr:TniQ family protein [Paenibacillus glycanilyticus]GLX71426.1 hypothetical protein MU1_57760 [Paenibacillus glycanilyticus]
MSSVIINVGNEESLVSYMTRFGEANGTSLLTVWNYTRNSSQKRYPQMKDARLLEISPLVLLDTSLLAAETELTKSRILSMTFFFVFRKLSGGSKAHHSRFLREVLREELCFCPHCLHEERGINLKWKIRGVDYCLLHNFLLLSECTHCNNKIELHQLVNVSVCPFCKSDLSKCFQSSPSEVDDKWLNHQKRTQQLWEQLLSPEEITIEPNEAAIRLLYLLNNKGPIFNRLEVLEMAYNLKVQLPWLLQVARNSLSKKRTLHIETLLRILIHYRMDIRAFIVLDIPCSFRDSLLNTRKNVSNFCCSAPWCNFFNKQGSLVSTGTGTKKYKNGQILHTHVGCTACGCRFALTRNNQIITKDDFIQAFEVIKTTDSDEADISRLSNYSNRKRKRVIAYFKTRSVFSNLSYTVDNNKLRGVIEDVQKGKTLSEIQLWNCWISEEEFFVYRYHSAVLKELLCYKRPALPRKIRDIYYPKIIALGEFYLENDQEITVEGISTEIGVSSNTLSKWGYNKVIKDYREKQREIRLQKWKENIYRDIDFFFESNVSEKILSQDVYKSIGVKQSYLCHFAPEINLYIKEHRENYNLQNELRD